jgi:hypothetical protein
MITVIHWEYLLQPIGQHWPARRIVILPVNLLPVYFLLAYFLLAYALLANIPTAAADERHFDRSGFATESLPIWTPLTDFERSVIHNISAIDAADAADADTLLALYLIASGDIRTEAEFNTHNQAIDDFLQQSSNPWRGSNERVRGAALLGAMHKHFFRASVDDTEQNGYQLNQSTLSGIFHTQTYNCISSALLYGVLAQRVGLKVSGAIMPSHAFILVELETGEQIEVETTSPAGFDVLRDERFFADEATAWFNARQLVVSNYEDYQQRRFVSAIGLGLENLWSQHTTAENMAYRDRLRLAEIKGHLQPKDYTAQHNRLIYYYREAEYLRQQNDQETLKRLHQHIEPFMNSMQVVAANVEAMADKEFQTVYNLVQTARARSFITNEQHDIGAQLAKTIILNLDDELPDANLIRSEALRALADYVDWLITRQNYQAARAVFEGVEHACHTEAVCINSLDKLYAAWGNDSWERQDWQAVIAIFHDYQSLGLNSPNWQNFHENLESSYLNIANQAWFDEDRDNARDYLDLCQRRISQATRCLTRMEEMRSAF